MRNFPYQLVRKLQNVTDQKGKILGHDHARQKGLPLPKSSIRGTPLAPATRDPTYSKSQPQGSEAKGGSYRRGGKSRKRNPPITLLFEGYELNQKKGNHLGEPLGGEGKSRGGTLPSILLCSGLGNQIDSISA